MFLYFEIDTKINMSTPGGKRIKLSGAQYSKIRENKKKLQEKQSEAMVKYFSKPENSKTTQSEDNHDSREAVICISSFESQTQIENSMNESEKLTDVTDITEEREDEQGQQIQESGTALPQLVQLHMLEKDTISDPAFWGQITDKKRQLLIEKGPIELQRRDFPNDARGRSFNYNHFNRQLNNGQHEKRIWLIYSESQNAIYCFPCKLFGQGNSWPCVGYSDWKNVSRALKSHELSSDHFSKFRKWKEFENRLSKNMTIDSETQRVMQLEVEYWRAVLKRIVAVLLLLAGQSLALRGSSDKLYARNNGNFLKLLELIAKFDPVMNTHLRRISQNETSVKYTSNKIQNELISILAKKVKSFIIEKALQSKYFSIIADCTPDISRVEQLSLIIRIVKQNSETNLFSIEEYFVGFIPVTNTTGEGLTEIILDIVTSNGLDLRNLRGQGYDNGSNMKGRHSGVQRRILNMYPRAFYVPCASHCLNLVVNDAAAASGQLIGFFSIIQELFVFFSSSTYRWDVLMKHITIFTLKQVCPTRWESRIESLKPLKYQLAEIYDALVTLSEDASRDAETKHLANSLALKIADFSFICSIIIWYDVLFQINMASKLLQSPKIDISSTLNVMKNSIDFLKKYREKFADVLVSAKEIAEKMGIDTTFTATKVARPRQKTKQFSYEAQDEPILNAEQKYRVEFFNYLIDISINSLDERFEQLYTHSNLFEFLYNIYALRLENETLILNKCKDLQIALTDGQDVDFDAIELKDELKHLSSILNEKKSPLEVLNFIMEINLSTIYPNVVIVLKILLTLPVTVASGERSFSKLKIIKNYLRSSMAQERLVDLAILSIEHEIVQNIDHTELIDEFAKIKARRVQL